MLYGGCKFKHLAKNQMMCVCVITVGGGRQREKEKKRDVFELAANRKRRKFVNKKHLAPFKKRNGTRIIALHRTRTSTKQKVVGIARPIGHTRW